MIESLASLFAGTAGLITGICLLVGLILLIIEIFIPGFGVFGITGSVLVVFSIVYRVITSGDALHLLYILSISIVVIALAVLIAIRSARFGLLSKTPFIQKGTSIPKDYGSNEKNFGFLINKKGITKTVCKPVGKMELDSVEYTVTTNGDYIDEETPVKVVEVDGSTIIVRKDEKKGRRE
ncbi:MAG: NfeD family protein [Clostridiales bacterium]|nr:NfeD family protein [Candidatus Apopatousia equi]